MTLDELFHERETSIDGKDVPFTLASKLPLSPCSRRTSSSTTTTTGSKPDDVEGLDEVDVDGRPPDVLDVDVDGVPPDILDVVGVVVAVVDVVDAGAEFGADGAESDAHFLNKAKAGSVDESVFSIA